MEGKAHFPVAGRDSVVRFGVVATYVIGDVHGCFETLQRLLGQIGWRSGSDRLFFTGDLVNAGPGSLDTVRWVRANAAGTVLGNHDLHFLAVEAGARKPRGEDTFGDILEAPDRRELTDWIRRLPFLIAEPTFLLVHAGLLPEWSQSEAVRVARDLEEELAARPGSFLPAMYGDKPRKWSATLEGEERRRVAINAMTRMRMLTEAGELDMDFKKPPEEAPPGLRPWFEATRTGGPLPRVFFGHWAALGLRVTNSVVGLDSGCAWGGWLTAYRLDDGAIFQERSELVGRRDPD